MLVVVCFVGREFILRRGQTPKKSKKRWWILHVSSGLCCFLGFMKPSNSQVSQ